MEVEGYFWILFIYKDIEKRGEKDLHVLIESHEILRK